MIKQAKGAQLGQGLRTIMTFDVEIVVSQNTSVFASVQSFQFLRCNDSTFTITCDVSLS